MGSPITGAGRGGGRAAAGGMSVAIGRPAVAELPASWTDGAGDTTCKPALDRELARPPARVPECVTDGGGGTTKVAGPPRVAWPIPAIARCAYQGNRGEGSTILGLPEFQDPT